MLELFQKNKRTAFIPFVVAGDPSPEMTERIVDLLIEEGADLLELGVPFSDAMADGPVIRAASERASQILGSIESVLDLAARIKTRHHKIPIIVFTYYNPLLKLGLKRFVEKAKAAKITAVLVVDLPLEEAGTYCQLMKQQNLKTIFLASPNTSSTRLQKISEFSTGFVYYISRTGVTGVQNQLSPSLEQEIARLKKLIHQPVAVGFGISTGEQARIVAQFSDAVVVGSTFVQLIAENSDNFVQMENKVRRLAQELSTAVHRDLFIHKCD